MAAIAGSPAPPLEPTAMPAAAFDPPLRETPPVALVTGASRGIGRAVARALLDRGWRVALLARDGAALRQMIDEADCAAASPGLAARALVLPCDVTDAAAVAAAFDATVERFGRLDLLFNNAGIFAPPAPIESFPLDAWKQGVDVNLTGMFLCLQQAFRVMQQQSPRGGRILNNGSIAAQSPRPHSVAYTATKHAITGLTAAAALEGRAHDIAVGQIDIGNVETDMTERMSAGVLQADGTTRPEPRMPMDRVVETVCAIARLPLDANVLSTTILATGMPFIGRG
jgi:NAD(P)-dependent dehydrogenase (short-subunit alcohol dehydrogenase family)